MGGGGYRSARKLEESETLDLYFQLTGRNLNKSKLRNFDVFGLLHEGTPKNPSFLTRL